MNNLEDNYSDKLWATKYVGLPDSNGFISKVFKTKKQALPIQKQREIIWKKKQYFWEYIPETVLSEFWDRGEYIIKQKFIKWKTLAHVDISELPAETLFKLLDLIKKYLKYHKEQWWDMDITWYQYYPQNISTIRKKIMNFLTIYNNFLLSTNIMIWEDWTPYMVDICETAHNRVQWKIKNLLAKPFIRLTIHKLEKTLKSKISVEKTNIELLNTLKN